MARQAGISPAAALRQRAVARLFLRGLTVEEIIEQMTADGNINVAAGAAWSPEQVRDDIRALNRVWRREMAKDVHAHKTRQLAELAELKRMAWLRAEWGIVLKCLQHESAILGTEAPKVSTITGPKGRPVLDAASLIAAFAKGHEEAGKTDEVDGADGEPTSDQDVEDGADP